MGKGVIISDLGDGQYSVRLELAGRSEAEAKVTAYETKITALQTQYYSMPETTFQEIWDKRIVGLQIVSLTKSKEYYENFPSDPVVTIYCADKTENITGNVGIIEVPGELVTGQVNIKPGFGGDPVWDIATDGQMTPAIAGGPWGVFLNKSMLPGWQKWKPTYRYGTIVADSIDFDADTCDVCLDPAYSSQQNLDVNQNQGFSECTATPPSGFSQFCVSNPTHPT